MEVWLSSGTHVDTIAERKERIEKQFESPDVAFGEGAEELSKRQQFKLILKILPVAPLIAAAMTFHIYLAVRLNGWIRSKLSDGERGSDVDIVRHLVSKYNADRHEIDNEPLGQYVSANRTRWGIVNWLLLLTITSQMWPSPLTARGAIVVIATLLCVGYVLLIALLAVANHARERAMADTITSHSGKYEQAVVVLGEGHHAGVGRQLKNHPEFSVINPEPESLYLGTRVILKIFELYERQKDR